MDDATRQKLIVVRTHAQEIARITSLIIDRDLHSTMWEQYASVIEAHMAMLETDWEPAKEALTKR